MSSFGYHDDGVNGGGGGGGPPQRKQGSRRYGGGSRQNSYNTPNNFHQDEDDHGYNNTANRRYNNNNDNQEGGGYGGSGRHGGGGHRHHPHHHHHHHGNSHSNRSNQRGMYGQPQQHNHNNNNQGGNSDSNRSLQRQLYNNKGGGNPNSDSNRSSQRGMYKKKKSLRGGTKSERNNSSHHTKSSYNSHESAGAGAGGSNSNNNKPIVVGKAVPGSSLQRALQQNSNHSGKNAPVVPRLDRNKSKRTQQAVEQPQQQQQQQQQQPQQRLSSSHRETHREITTNHHHHHQEENNNNNTDQHDSDNNSDSPNDDETTSVSAAELPQTRIGTCLDDCNWNGFFQELEQLMSDNELSVFGTPHLHPQSTLFHTTVWKAPPRVVRLILDLLSQQPSADNFVADLCTRRDQDANTPLHLACANVTVGNDMDKNLHIVSFLAECAPQAVDMQNDQGDTPLTLLVSSPAACASSRELEEEGLDIVCSVVSQLIQASSTNDLSSIHDSTGATVLHTAIGNDANEHVLFELLRSSSTIASVGDERGMVPLHYVAAKPHTSSPKFVKELLKSYPEALTHASVHGDTPLHIFISNSTSTMGKHNNDLPNQAVMDALMGVVEGATQGVPKREQTQQQQQSPFTMLNQDHLSPLHACAFLDVPSQVTSYFMKSSSSIPKYASLENNFGATPLHLAVAQPEVETSIANVEALATREAASTPDRLLRTPLHVASQNPHATKELIELLTRLHPDACGVKTQRGHLPLHLACQSQAKEDVVRPLVEAYPKATEARNKSNNTPLHDAAKYKASSEVVQLLLNTYMDAVYIQNQYGNLPLHCATAYEAPNDVVQLILNAWPDGASMQNKNQDAPLHYAAAYWSTVDAVKPIIDAAPAAVLLLNSTGESPIDRAKANNAPEEIIELLESSAAVWAKKASTDGWASFGGGMSLGEDLDEFGAAAV